MTWDEAVCWAFDTLPSRLDELYWTITFEDLRTKLRLKFGYEQHRVIQDFQTLAIIVGKVFGGSKDTKGQGGSALPAHLEGVKPVQNAEEARLRFAAVMRAARG